MTPERKQSMLETTLILAAVSAVMGGAYFSVTGRKIFSEVYMIGYVGFYFGYAFIAYFDIFSKKTITLAFALTFVFCMKNIILFMTSDSHEDKKRRKKRTTGKDRQERKKSA